MKTVVTHLHPDLDAAASAWLVKRYFAGWDTAQLRFVPAGQTLDNKLPDENPEIIHVDTGKGKFDHHHLKERLSATLVVLNYIKKNNMCPEKDLPALERLAEFATIIDNFEDLYLPEPNADIYDLSLGYLVDGLSTNTENNEEVLMTSFKILDAALILLKKKIKAEVELQKGTTFESKWGKSIALLSDNSETEKLAQKSGYNLVIRKDPIKGFVRLKLPPKATIDLSHLYELIKQTDTEGDWFLHISGKMLLNGSSKNPNVTPSKLSLEEVIQIAQKG